MHTINWNQIKHANRAALSPIKLELKDCDDALLCKEFVRVMPGKRFVAFGTWANKPVVAKVFYSRRAENHAKRDAEGVKALITAGVSTPALYFEGMTRDKRARVLIFEFVEGQNLETLWQEKTSVEEMSHLMHAMTLELATHHVLGVLQHDLHFKNFIFHKKHIYTIDGGEVETFLRPLTKKESLDNLGLFFAQFGVGADDLQKELFETYTRSRGWIVKPRDLTMLQYTINKWHQKRLQDFNKKLLRNCSAFAVIEKRGAMSLYDRTFESKDLLTYLQQPDMAFETSETELLKNGRSSTVAKFYVDGRALVIKRYNIKDGFHWFRRCLRATRAAVSWQVAQRLQLFGVPTAKPIAFVEKRFLGLRNKSYFLMEHIHGPHLGQFFTQTMDPTVKTNMAKKIVAIFEGLAKLNMTHGDLKMTNILIDRERPVIIDLDGMKQHKNQWQFKRAFQQDIRRFMRNWQRQDATYQLFEPLITDMYHRLGVLTHAGAEE